jgi:MoaA/NifB/PqqE/SkfB family radical SAM enzyme
MPEQTGIAKDAWLDFLWLELTNKCNLSRVHCYQRRRTLAV